VEPNDRYDAIVVGARVAGAATAMLLARRGRRVLLVDRDRRGADTLSTLALMRAGVLQLHRWDLLDAVRAAGTPPIRTTSFVYGDDPITVPIKPRYGVDALFAPRRTVLDVLLADAAAAAGAEVRRGARLVDLVRAAGGRVTGAVIEEPGGSRQVVDDRLVIGADGLRSTVAKLAGAPVDHEGRHACGTVYGFFPGLENRGNRWHYQTTSFAGAIPTNGGDSCVFVAVPPARFTAELQGDMAAGFRRVLAECAPSLARELPAGAPAEPFRGWPGHPGVMRRSHGPGWALVGDAGYFKDPITAHGITDALRDAELVARAALEDTDAALAGYQRTRDALSHELFEITDAIATFEHDLDAMRTLHLDLSRTMNAEVEALLALDRVPAPGGDPIAN